MIKKFKNIIFAICFLVLVSKNVYTPVLVNVNSGGNIQAKIFESA